MTIFSANPSVKGGTLFSRFIAPQDPVMLGKHAVLSGMSDAQIAYFKEQLPELHRLCSKVAAVMEMRAIAPREYLGEMDWTEQGLRNCLERKIEFLLKIAPNTKEDKARVAHNCGEYFHDKIFELRKNGVVELEQRNKTQGFEATLATIRQESKEALDANSGFAGKDLNDYPTTASGA